MTESSHNLVSPSTVTPSTPSLLPIHDFPRRLLTTNAIGDQGIAPFSEPEDSRRQFSRKLVSPCCSSSKPLFWRPACSGGLSQSPTDPSGTSARSDSSVTERFDRTSVLLVCEPRNGSRPPVFSLPSSGSECVRRIDGGRLSRGVSDANMLPLARLAFVIAATVRGRGSAGWAFAFSIQCHV
jgi:hypothetical protein